MSTFRSLFLLFALWIGVTAANSSAFYRVSPAAEGQTPCAKAIRLDIGNREAWEGRPFWWWTMTVLSREGNRFGVRILSERVPLASADGPGEIARYLYRDEAGGVFEYRDAATGKTLLPEIQFRESFLPRPSRYADYETGWASAGAFLGHVLSRSSPIPDLAPVSFEDVILLELRTDLIVMAQSVFRGVGEPPEEMPEAIAGEAPRQAERPCTLEEHEHLRLAGFNLFGVGDDKLEWAKAHPVFFAHTPEFPDSFYRSNWRGWRVFLDEPMTRLGWAGEIPERPSGPEQVAEALRQRVAASFTPRERRIAFPWGVFLGTLDLYEPPCPSWETEYNSAWYQLAGGAAAIVHEGRYRHGIYGWEVHELFGSEGTNALDLRVQMDCICAFLRGAARAFNRDWGISLYPEGDPEMRLPAMLRAYDLGARYIWFWTHHPQMSYELEEELGQALMKHVSENPRGDIGSVNRSATTGIVLPRGYAFSWYGSWGMDREAISAGDASYGDVSAAAIWEGIICSKLGIPFDFLVDEPFIRHLGYERLVYVHHDASVSVEPPWETPRAPGGIRVGIEMQPVPNIASRGDTPPEYIARWVDSVRIDGDLSEWEEANWIALSNEPDAHGFHPGSIVDATITYSLKDPSWDITWDHRTETSRFMGMSLDQIDLDYERKYHNEGFHGRGVVITGVEPDSPADRAGILEGDVMLELMGKNVDYTYNPYFDVLKDLSLTENDTVQIRVKRSGRQKEIDPSDLGAEVAFAVDDGHLYLAARVTDDIQHQTRTGWNLWAEDCLQIGLDPTLERRTEGGYGEEDHELGFALTEEGPVAWRYHGRRGQPLGRMDTVRLGINRTQGETIYEAAIPLHELLPLAPDLWPEVGFNIVVNDSDGERSGRLELRQWAMSRWKKTADFAAMQFEPSPNRDEVSSAILWRKRVAEEDGFFRIIAALSSPEARAATVEAMLESLDSPETPSSRTAIVLPVTRDPVEHSLLIRTNSPPGRYRLSLRILGPESKLVTADSLPVYIHPRGSE